MSKLEQAGWALFDTQIDGRLLDALRDSVFTEGEAGTRCLLDAPVVKTIAAQLRAKLAAAGHLPPHASAIQAIAFDKTPGTNWKVSWHQDLMFPFGRTATAAGFDLPSKKDGIDYARPPREILDGLLAVRLHVDDCDETNGPLRVSPGSHHSGILKSAAIASCVEKHGEQPCLAKRGQAVLMKPLTLHASSPATSPRHRRVLHVVFYAGGPIPEPWHRSV